MISSQPEVTLIIPVYNVGVYLVELLDSIRAQDFGNFKVLIGDDGSTDETESVVRPYLADARFHYQKWNRNRGLGSVMKDLMSSVTTPYWCNPGGDDRLHPEFLNERLKAANEVKDCIMVHGPPRQIDSKGQEISHFPIFDLPRQLYAGEFLELLIYHNVVTNPGVLVKTAITRKCLSVMRTDLGYAPDWYWWILHASHPGSIVFDKNPRMDYRFHPQSLSGSANKRWMRAEEIRRAPLLALHDASEYSSSARQMLGRHGAMMRALWGMRAVRVLIGSRGQHPLPPVPWLTAGFLGTSLGLFRLLLTWPFHGPRERMARKRESFAPSGIATADHGSLTVYPPR